jgi:hypothetical protein
MIAVGTGGKENPGSGNWESSCQQQSLGRDGGPWVDSEALTRVPRVERE